MTAGATLGLAGGDRTDAQPVRHDSMKKMTTPGRPKIVIGEDHALVRFGIRYRHSLTGKLKLARV